MSASSKKKLRKEQQSAALTERQQKEQSEAKKLKTYSIIFIAIMLVVVISTIAILTIRGIQNSGVIQKNTVAATIGDHKINAVELNYYYNDIISTTYNDWYNSYGESMSTYLMMMGLDLSAPLDKQAYYGDEETTWADYFLDSALERAKSDYVLCKAAEAAGFTLSEEELESIENGISNLNFYAMLSGFSNTSQYLRNSYGYGANEKSYREYSERSALASAYYNAHNEDLSYDDAAIREYEAEKFADYSYFDFASYYVNYTKFLGEGTKDDNGNTTYTDEQHAQAREDAKAAAESLLAATNVEELDKLIGELEINKSASTPVTSTKSTATLGSAISETYVAWVTDDSRVENDITVIPYQTTTTDADGKETTSLSGYYVVLFQGSDDNVRPMGNVRHLLVKFEGGTKDEDGNTTYSDTEKAAAKQEADGYLETWKNGDATEASFIELVKSHSDDSSAAEGGLFENIHPKSNYVSNFLNWSIDQSRKVGDAEVIETEYGYHVMYYVGASELNYRDYLITNDMRAEDLKEWYDGMLESVTLTEGDLSHVNTEMIISPAA